MSGQVNLVSGEKVCFVSCPGHSYICANGRCNNILTNFELARLKDRNSNRRLKWNYCRKCRHQLKSKVDKIRCDGCFDTFLLNSSSTDMFRKLCTECAEARKETRMRLCNKIAYDRTTKYNRQFKRCIICGKSVGHGKSKLCSAECAKIRLRDTQIDWHQKKVAKLKVGRMCKLCDNPIPEFKPTNALFCTTSCTRKYSMKEYRKKNPIDKKKNRICIQCNGLIPDERRKNVKYCCIRCAQNSGHKRKQINKGTVIV